MNQIIRSELKWALIYFVLLIAYLFAGKLLGVFSQNIDKHGIFSTLFIIPTIVIYVLAIREKRKKHYHNVLTYWKGVKSALILTFFMVLLGTVTPSIATAIAPEYYENSISYAVERGDFTQEQAEEFYNPGTRTKNEIIGTTVFGIILSLIIPLFTIKKKKHSPDQNNP